MDPLTWKFNVKHKGMDYVLTWTVTIPAFEAKSMSIVGPVEFKVHHERVADELVAKTYSVGHSDEFRKKVLAAVKQDMPDSIII